MARPHQLPARWAAGAYILNSGMDKVGADRETAAGLHGAAAVAYPFLKDRDPAGFTALLARAELALGAALLLPMVPSALAGAALTVFAGGLLGVYLKTPGLREEGTLKPTRQGIGHAKDVWLLGIGLSLLIEEARGR